MKKLHFLTLVLTTVRPHATASSMAMQKASVSEVLRKISPFTRSRSLTSEWFSSPER